MKTVKKALVGCVAMLVFGMLSGCEKETTEKTDNYVMPKGMEDCKVYVMTNTGGGAIVVVRCPNSNTTTQSGNNAPVTIVEGNEVVPNVAKPAQVHAGKNTDEVEINGETYRKSESMKEVQVNGETYKKVQ